MSRHEQRRDRSGGVRRFADVARSQPLRMALVASLALAVNAAALAGGNDGGGVPQHAYGLRIAQASPTEAPRIGVPPTILAKPAAPTPLQIAINPGGAAPRHSFLRLRGLPPAVSLTEGHAIAPGAWAVPLVGLPNLQMNVPAGLSGRSELIVSLVGEDGVPLAEARVTLIIAPMPIAAPPAERPTPAPPPAGQQAPAARPALSPAERESAEKMVARGERDLQEGNVALARQFFLRAAEAGLARGALLLAATYDPRELARMRVQGVQPNPELARKWYERARELGAPEAEERLTNLSGG